MAVKGTPSDDPMVLDGVSVFATTAAGDPVPLLDNISLALAEGEWLNLVGVNGSGKTTLARLLAGLYVEGSTGVISRGFAGEPASPIVLQRPEAQLFGETPREEILFALEWRQVPPQEIAGRIEEVLGLTGLQGLADVRWDALSGGQRQLAAVAAAAACRTPLVVFDEATSMLDEANRAAVLRLARALYRQGTAVVWVTQRLDELLPEDRVIAIADGRMKYDGLVRAFFYGDMEDSADITPCESCGLRLPYMSALALQWRRTGRLSGLLPVTRQEWREVWGMRDDGRSDRETVLTIKGMRLRRGIEGDAQPAELKLEPGTLTLVIGPNGAGKTTWLEKLGGLRDPESLTVRYGNEPLWLGRTFWPGWRLNRAALLSYGYAPQNPEHALFARSVEEELAYSLRPYSDQAADHRKAMDKALGAVGFDTSWLVRDPSRMSGGERRRTALASLFVTPAAWLLLDEPTAGLDREGHERVGEHLVDLKKDGRGIILISHDSDWALPLADQVLLMHTSGEIVSCTPEELVEHLEWFEEAGMQTPEWLLPVREVHRAGVPLQKLWNAEEAAEVMAGLHSFHSLGSWDHPDRNERPAATHSFSERARRHSAHRLTRFDPRGVWLGYALLAAGLFSLSNWLSLAAGAAVVFALLWAGNVSLARWRGAIGSFVYFVLVMSCFAAVAKTGDGRFWDTDAFVGTLFPLTRTLLVMLIGLGLPLVMTPLSLRRSLEQLVSWRGKTSPFWQRFLLTVALLVRFVPVLLAEWERFKLIFLARGKETAKTPRVLMRRLRGVTLPLMLALFRLGDDVAIALESRGVRKGINPTRGTRLRWRWADTGLVAGAALLAGVFLFYG